MLLPWSPMHWPTKTSSTRQSSTNLYPQVFTTLVLNVKEIYWWTNYTVKKTVIFVIVLCTLCFSDSDHWPVTTGYLFTLEATAYALLALVKAKVSISLSWHLFLICVTPLMQINLWIHIIIPMLCVNCFLNTIIAHFANRKIDVYIVVVFVIWLKEFEDAAPVVRWLTNQRTSYGGYQSTQVKCIHLNLLFLLSWSAVHICLFVFHFVSLSLFVPVFYYVQSTIVVYQALSEYWVNVKEHNYEMNIEVEVEGRSKSLTFNVNNQNAFQTKTTNVVSIKQNTNTMS